MRKLLILLLLIATPLFGSTLSNHSSTGVVVSGSISGGTDTRVLFDDAGVLGEDAGFTFDKTNNYLFISGRVCLDSLTTCNTNIGASGPSGLAINTSSGGITIGAAGATSIAGAVTEPSVTHTNTPGADVVVNGTFTGAATGWTETAGWAWAGDAEPHSSNGTGTLTPSTPLVLTVGQMYLLTYTVSGWSVGTVTASAGGQTGQAAGANGTFKFYFVASATTTLAFTPTNTARFTLDDVSLVPVTQEITSTTGPVTITKSLTDASSDQAAARLDYSVNKAAGNDTGLVINQAADTSSPGTSRLLDLQSAGVSKQSIDNTGAFLSQIVAPAGSATTPAITFTGETGLNSGLYNVDGGMGITCNAAPAVSFCGTPWVSLTGNTLGFGTSAIRIGRQGTNGTFEILNTGTSGGDSATVTPFKKTLANDTATAVVKITMTSNSTVGGVLTFTVSDETTWGAISGTQVFNAVDAAGTITCNLGTVNTTAAAGGSAGFALNATPVTCADAGSNVLSISIRALTTGGTDTLTAKGHAETNGSFAVVPQ